MRAEADREGREEMGCLFDKQAEMYVDARPTYSAHWYSMLASRTPRHSLARDVGVGNGLAALCVAQHYNRVITTDASAAQLKCAMQHPKVHYVHTPIPISNAEIMTLIGGENSVNLITVAQAMHWFDLPNFYSLLTRLLRKPGGVVPVWCYNGIEVSFTFDMVMKRFHETTLPFWDPNIKHISYGYEKLPSPFKSVGLGCEGEPLPLDIPKDLSFEGFLRVLRSWSAITMVKEQGVDPLSEGVVRELEDAWGDLDLVRCIVYKALMLASTV